MKQPNISSTELNHYAAVFTSNIDVETQTEICDKKNQKKNFSILPYTGSPKKRMIGSENNNRKQKNNRGILFDFDLKTGISNNRRQSIGPINSSYYNELKSPIQSNIRFIESNCNPESVDLLLTIESDATFL